MTDQRMNSGRSVSSLFRRRIFWVGFTLAGVAGVIAANAHLVIVAVGSQPNCVAHHKGPTDTAGTYRAAKSSCNSREEATK